MPAENNEYNENKENCIVPVFFIIDGESAMSASTSWIPELAKEDIIRIGQECLKHQTCIGLHSYKSTKDDLKLKKPLASGKKLPYNR